jgi:hypothetical protein
VVTTAAIKYGALFLINELLSLFVKTVSAEGIYNIIYIYVNIILSSKYYII